MRVLIPVNKLNFSSDEYLKIESFNMGEQNEICNKIEFDQYFKNASFDMGEQIELF